MQIPPAFVRASWPPANYLDPITHGRSNIIINFVLYPLVLLTLSLRVYTRVRISSSFGLNDTLILVALIPATVFLIVSLLADLAFDWTRHQWDIPFTQAVRGLKMILVAECMFATGITLTKLSMLTLIKRIHAGYSLFWKRIIDLAIIIVLLQGSIFCLVVLFQCRPPQEFWALSVDPQPECINQGTVLLVGGVINTLTDFAVVLIPIRTVMSLKLPGRQKLIVTLLFGLGFLSAAAGVARTYYTYKVTTTYDQTWAAYPVWLTSALELYIGMICCSIPATKPFFSKYFPKLLSINKASEENSEARKIYDYSNTGQGGELGTARLEANKVLLSPGSIILEDLKEPGFRGSDGQKRSFSVFEK